MPWILEAAPRVTRQLFDYVRQGVLDLLNLETDVQDRLAGMSLIDVTPFEPSITGVLSGNVEDPDQLGFDGDPYPRMDWTTTIDDLEALHDGRLTIKPRHTFTARIASGAQFEPWKINVAVGLNDPAEFPAAPPSATLSTAIPRLTRPRQQPYRQSSEFAPRRNVSGNDNHHLDSLDATAGTFPSFSSYGSALAMSWSPPTNRPNQ
jgi:hypothetical protein